MIIRSRSSVTDERKRQEAAQLAQAIERDRVRFFKAVLEEQNPEKAGALDRSIAVRTTELYHRAREAAGLDK